MTHLDTTGYSLAPKQFTSAAEVMANADRVRARRNREWARPTPLKQLASSRTLSTAIPHWELLGEAFPSGDYDIPQLVRWTDEYVPPTFSRATVEQIQKAMCKAAKMTLSDMRSARKFDSIVVPRQLAIALAKRLTSRSLPDLGRRFGGRDHTTVLHAIRKMQPVIDEIGYLADTLELVDLSKMALDTWARIRPPSPPMRGSVRA